MPRNRKSVDQATVRDELSRQAARAFEVEHPSLRKRGTLPVVKMRKRGK